MYTCVDHADRVAEAAHPRVRLDPPARPIRWVTPPYKSPVGYGQPAHAGTYPTAPLTPAQLVRCSTYSPPVDPYEHCCWLTVPENQAPPLNPYCGQNPSVINKDWRIQVAETRTVYCKPRQTGEN